MPDGDVTVYYRLVPTQDSVKKAAESIVGKINSSIGKTTEGISKSFGESGFGKGFGKTLKSMGKSFAKIPGVGAVGEGAAAGAAEGGGAGGAMAGIAGSLTALVGIGLVISAALMIVSAFFEAVGPIIKVMSKVLTAMMLIMLMPLLRILLPYLPTIIKALISTSQFLAKIMTVLLNVVGKWLKSIWDSLLKVGEKVGAAFEALGKGDVAGFFKNILGAGVDLLIAAMVTIAGPILFGLASVFKENLPAIISVIVLALEAAFVAVKNILVDFASNVFGTETGNRIKTALDSIQTALFSEDLGFWDRIKGVINAIGVFVFGEETWASIKDAVKFVSDIFTVEGIWTKIKEAVDYIGETVFGKGIWEDIKQAITDVNTMIANEWQTIIATLKDVGAALKPIADMFQEINKPVGPSLADRFFAGDFFKFPKPDITTSDTVHDFISRPGMGVQSFSPSDTIFGMKNPKNMGGKDIVINNTLNVSADVDKEKFRKILVEFAREQGRELRKKVSYMGGTYA